MKRTFHAARFFSYPGLAVLVLIAAFGAVWISNQTFLRNAKPARPSGRVGIQLFDTIVELSAVSNPSNCRMFGTIRLSVVCDEALIKLAALEVKASQQGWQYRENGPSPSWARAIYYHRNQDTLCVEVDGQSAIKSIGITRHF